jgi:hypothetical protein
MEKKKTMNHKKKWRKIGQFGVFLGVWGVQNEAWTRILHRKCIKKHMKHPILATCGGLTHLLPLPQPSTKRAKTRPISIETPHL